MTTRATKRKETPSEAEESIEKKNKAEEEDTHQFPSHLNASDHSQFDHFLFELLYFRSKQQNFNVNKEEHPQLHAWLQHLKREYKNRISSDQQGSLLTDEQVKVLEFLHVPLTSRGDDHWNRFYELLKDYKERHGHVLVPRLCETPGLGDWVTDQRRQYKAFKQGQSSQMSEARRQKLEALGFAWQVRNRPEWDTRYNELLEYKKARGDCKVPQHYKPNKALGKWVAKQREQYKLLQSGKHSFLTPYRVEKLKEVGFVWQIRTALESEVRNAMAESAAAATDSEEAPKIEEATTEASIETDIPESVVEELHKEAI